MKTKKNKKHQTHRFQVMDITEFPNDCGEGLYVIQLKMIGTSPASSLFVRVYEIRVNPGYIDAETVVKFHAHNLGPIILKGFIVDNLIYLSDEYGYIGSFDIKFRNA